MERKPALDHKQARIPKRDQTADSRDARADAREIELLVREQTAQFREEAVRVRSEIDAIRSERQQLAAQMRAANERLVVAAIHSDELAEAAALDEARFRSLVATSAAVVWRADAKGVVQIDFSAETWRAFTGGDPQRWFQLVHPKDRGRVSDLWAEAIRTSRPYTCQFRIQTRDDGYAWVVARAVPIVKSGVVREWIGMMIDVSDRVRIEETREQFIGILGHDLRGPLTAILLGMKRLVGLPAPLGDVVSQIKRSANRMSLLILDVMDFARGRLGGGIPVTFGPCNLRTLCSDLIAELRQAHPDRNIRFETSGDLRAECDKRRFEQVLSNLLGNALTHGEDPIRVGVSEDRDEIVMTVHNRGVPIPAGMLPTMFDPFVQGARTTRVRSEDGLGLGLYIASEIIRAHGGTIAVTSTVADGTTFTVRVPRTPRCVRVEA